MVPSQAPKLVSCTNCRVSKRHCDKVFPCSRCRYMCLPCIPQLRGRGRPTGSGRGGHRPRQDVTSFSSLLPSQGPPLASPLQAFLAGHDPSLPRQDPDRCLRACAALLSLKDRPRTSVNPFQPQLVPGSFIEPDKDWGGEDAPLDRFHPCMVAQEIMASSLHRMREGATLDILRANALRVRLEGVHTRTPALQGGGGTAHQRLIAVIHECLERVTQADVLRSQQSAHLSDHDGRAWVEQLVLQPDSFALSLYWEERTTEVMCNAHMSELVLGAAEVIQRCQRLACVPLIGLATCLGHRDIRHFFDAVTDVSCGAHHAQDRVGLIELRLRAGVFLRCFTTLRCHWSPDLSVCFLAVSFQPIAGMPKLSATARATTSTSGHPACAAGAPPRSLANPYHAV